MSLTSIATPHARRASILTAANLREPLAVNGLYAPSAKQQLGYSGLLAHPQSECRTQLLLISVVLIAWASANQCMHKHTEEGASRLEWHTRKQPFLQRATSAG